MRYEKLAERPCCETEGSIPDLVESLIRSVKNHKLVRAIATQMGTAQRLCDPIINQGRPELRRPNANPNTPRNKLTAGTSRIRIAWRRTAWPWEPEAAAL